MTHWRYGSVTTGNLSATPNVCSTNLRSDSEVCGVMRSTIVDGNATCVSIHRASPGSFNAANDTSAVRAGRVSPGMLSQQSTVNGATPARRRRSSASARYPHAVA